MSAVIADGSRDPSGTRARLVAAALAELDDKGYSALRVDDVARRAGLTSGAIYGTFATKHDLLVAALRARRPDALDAATTGRLASAERSLLASALSVLDDKGYRATRIADVARRAGVSVAHLSVAYPTKHHVLIAAMVAKEPDAFRQALQRSGATLTAVDDEVPTTDRLLTATLSVLDDHGYRGATVGEIARRAGLTTGAIYANYGSKEALLNAALGRRYADLFRSALDEVEAANATGGLRGALGAVLTKEAGLEHQAILEVLAAASRDEPVRPSVERQLARRHEVLVALLEESKEVGQLAADVSTDALAYVVQLLALGNIVGQAVGLRPPDTADLLGTIDRLGAGLRPLGGPPP